MIIVRYANDPLCGWCFALLPALQHLTQYSSKLKVQCLYGQLFPGAKAKIMGLGFREHLDKGLPAVEAASPARFGDAFRQQIMGNPHYVYETTMAARAIRAIAICSGSDELGVLLEFQRQFFVRGISANEISNFLILAEHFAASPRYFLEVFYSNELSSALDESAREAKHMQMLAARTTLPVLLVESKGRQLVLDHETDRAEGALYRQIMAACS